MEHIYLSIFLSIYLSLYLSISLSLYLSLSMCIYTYMYVYIYIYIHIHTHVVVLLRWRGAPRARVARRGFWRKDFTTTFVLDNNLFDPNCDMYNCSFLDPNCNLCYHFNVANKALPCCGKGRCHAAVNTHATFLQSSDALGCGLLLLRRLLLLLLLMMITTTTTTTTTTTRGLQGSALRSRRFGFRSCRADVQGASPPALHQLM